MSNERKQPNILFLMSDEHRADVTGYEGNSVIRTPVLDELARTGVVFRNAYTPSPICVPGRQAIMSGQFPRHCGCERFGEDLTPGYMTYSRRLAEFGYETAVSGKLHHTGTDQMQGWTTRISGDMQIAPRYLGEGAGASRRSLAEVKWNDAKEITRAGVGRGPCVAHDEYAVEGALNFIENYFSSPYYDREQTHPLLLKVSLLQPHYPYLTSEEKFTYYLNRVEPFMGQEASEHPFLGQRQIRPDVDVTERELRRATAVYYGMIETIDEQYGRVIHALEHAGQNLDDWIIIYTTDHGEMLGEHGIWEKQKFYEGSVRVPLIIRYPKGFAGGRIVQENVNLCDLFATLCDLTGIETPRGLDSRSLVPLIKSDAESGWDNETVSQFGGTNLMIKKDHLKYQYYGERMPEVLFDLERDPEERHNMIDDPKYTGDLVYFQRRRVDLGFGGAGWN
ncbi:sulfatase-like hydrolase/transferase [Paenibacillus agricola]|uniref:Sulfatase-like hydrolase/transferase n=1 Tax=Paenibacillus agricola TaxID=2716264 RepID=A0ABX0JCA7_9BACL|nr:sulfatase-like hydrolase/transferase [Paenibacillus agricola]NHN32502.1 sulfatase-like hydrolase/transferase [Paenibacillus agricola]